MIYRQLITSLINETIINMHYHLHIISLAFINNHENHKPYKHQDFLCGNRVTGKKTTKAFTNFRFPLPGLNTGWGNQPLTIYLWRTKTPLITI